MVGQCAFPDHEQKKQGQCEHQHRLFLKHAAARDVVHTLVVNSWRHTEDNFLFLTTEDNFAFLITSSWLVWVAICETIAITFC